jgi:glucose/arabinose dehydrogenase
MKKISLLTFAILLGVLQLFAQPIISFQPVSTSFASPLDVVSANDGANRLFVVEKAGTIRIWNGSSIISTPFLDIRTLVKSTGSEQGFLSLAFHPNYITNGYFFVYYTNVDGNVTIARYTRTDLNTANSSSGVILMTFYKPFANHNGGKLNFGTDGLLYFGTGDGGSGGDPGNRAQNGDSILGKMVRIDINNPNPPYYSIPPTNPYLSSPIRDDVIAIGFRNPWRWSFDKQTGDMWIADVGQNAWEEVNYVPAANILDRNYGWPCFEGTHAFNTGCSAQPNNVVPVFDYPHNNTNGGFSITGGYRYRGTEFSFLNGYYLCADYVSGKGWLIYPNGSGGWSNTMQTWMTGISSFGEDPAGNLYATTLGGGLYKVNASNPLPVKLVSFTGTIVNARPLLQFKIQGEQKGDVYIIENRTDLSLPYAEVYRTTAINSSTSNSYSTTLSPITQITYYRLKIMSVDQQVHYSQVVLLNSAKDDYIKAIVQGNNIMIYYPTGTSYIKLYDAVGRLLKQQPVAPTEAQTMINIEGTQKGLINLYIQTPSGPQTTRIIY